jgi:hypothetical protein
MTDDRRKDERRRSIRRAEQAAAEGAVAPKSPGTALIVASPSRQEQPEPKGRRDGFATFAAQVLGQGGQKRGLRGGPETLDRARSAYLETEWSGPSDRRPTPGRTTKTEI